MIIRIYPNGSPKGAMRAQAGGEIPKGWNPCFLTIWIIAAPKVRQTILSPLRGFDPHRSNFFSEFYLADSKIVSTFAPSYVKTSDPRTEKSARLYAELVF